MVQGEEGEGKKSILDVDPEVQAMMEMAGKTLHSQGLREPEEDEDQWGTTGQQAPSSPGINTWWDFIMWHEHTRWHQTSLSLFHILRGSTRH